MHVDPYRSRRDRSVSGQSESQRSHAPNFYLHDIANLCARYCPKHHSPVADCRGLPAFCDYGRLVRRLAHRRFLPRSHTIALAEHRVSTTGCPSHSLSVSRAFHLRRLTQWVASSTHSLSLRLPGRPAHYFEIVLAHPPRYKSDQSDFHVMAARGQPPTTGNLRRCLIIHPLDDRRLDRSENPHPGTGCRWRQRRPKHVYAATANESMIARFVSSPYQRGHLHPLHHWRPPNVVRSSHSCAEGSCRPRCA
ncbi:hypothetical protein BamMEX5DRAFT_3491 [Burkholderia ambifaria MEX-5]|uniref:Uncharacterized protein n=1 Tax=Burkholderia ambifaria MEX-5 TaxID=396597 RepID=B1T6S5_9BURK|nr:hypothetical protein BamMEX5DRAFT_3491 [Burkholderia ambifaria MEX-5]